MANADWSMQARRLLIRGTFCERLEIEQFSPQPDNNGLETFDAQQRLTLFFLAVSIHSLWWGLSVSLEG